MRTGEIVRVPLGPREVLAYVLETEIAAHDVQKLRSIVAREQAPRAFDETGLALARFIAEYYLCTLGEAISAVVLGAAVPRMVDRFEIVGEKLQNQRIPQRLHSLLAQQFADGFAIEQLLRHPEARRIGDRASLMRSVGALTRSGALVRKRQFLQPRTSEYRIAVLYANGSPVRGPKMQALHTLVATQPGIPRADVLLAGFSNAMIARAVKSGALRLEMIAPKQTRAATGVAQLPPLTKEQKAALDALAQAINAGGFSESLLHGVTGSGKTLIYIACIQKVLARGGRAIVLVPEISLTPQTARRFEDAFGERVAVLHSALSDRERFDAWQACAQGHIDVVVGARSAVFAPLKDVRILVVDEAHESSYKQDSSPRYHAVTVARKRMQLEGGLLVLGSATPALEAYAAARRNSIGYLRIDTRATQQALPAVHVIDLRNQRETGASRALSAPLAQALQERFERGAKSVLFINRRGSAGFLLCRNCGAVPECSRCSVSLVAHAAERLLRCHYCDFQAPLPLHCEVCSERELAQYGFGTQSVAAEVEALLPNARIIRMDSDTTTKVGDHARLLSEFAEHGHVLVGTQMVAKGLDFPEVTLVGIVAADVGLHVPDFRAAERSFALIMQAAGRSGRARPGEAFIQTYAPEHPAIRFAAAHDFDAFATEELKERKALQYPPFSRLAYVGVIGRSKSQVVRHADEVARRLRTTGEHVIGPAPFPIARLNNEWRYRLAVRSTQPTTMREHLRAEVVPYAKKARGVRLFINVDP